MLIGTQLTLPLTIVALALTIPASQGDAEWVPPTDSAVGQSWAAVEIDQERTNLKPPGSTSNR